MVSTLHITTGEVLAFVDIHTGTGPGILALGAAAESFDPLAVNEIRLAEEPVGEGDRAKPRGITAARDLARTDPATLANEQAAREAALLRDVLDALARRLAPRARLLAGGEEQSDAEFGAEVG